MINEEFKFSLLYNKKKIDKNNIKKNQIKEQLWNDLNLDLIVEMFELNKRDNNYIKEILLELNSDIDIIKYRQEILEDLLSNEKIITELEEIIPDIEKMTEYQQRFYMKRDKGFFDAISRLNELETFLNLVKRFLSLLDDSTIEYKSEALKILKKILVEITEKESFKRLNKELPELIHIRNNIRSVSVGINLNKNLESIEATLLSINKEAFKESNFIKKIIGKVENDKEGIAKLHVKPLRREYDLSTPYTSFLNMGKDRAETIFLDLFFKDISVLMKNIGKPITQVTDKYFEINTHFLVQIYYELKFYLGAIKMIKLQKKLGLKTCKPKIVDKEEKILNVKNSYNINLLKVLKNQEKKEKLQNLILNDIKFNEEGRILILTGPNSGGKTTYIESIGLIHILAQAGLYVPAEEVTLSPVEEIFTHFQSEEEVDKEAGRLGQESKKFKEIFELINEYSLVIMNESFSSTSEVDSFYIAKDIMNLFCLIGNRAIFATHIFELANNINGINKKKWEK